MLPVATRVSALEGAMAAGATQPVGTFVEQSPAPRTDASIGGGNTLQHEMLAPVTAQGGRRPEEQKDHGQHHHSNAESA